MSISISDIQNDISEYQDRISKAQVDLANLPAGYLPYQEHKKREKVRRDLQAEVKHVQGLIGYAHEGIELRQKAVTRGLHDPAKP